MPKTGPIVLPEPTVLPDDAIIVSFSELDTYRQCPLKHSLAYGQRWTREPEEGSALRRGTIWHLVMEAHYLSLKADDEAGKVRSLSRAEAAVEPFLSTDGHQSPDQALIQWMYEGYVEQHGTDDDWIILAVEYKLVAWLPLPEGGPSDYAIKAKLDLIIQHRRTKKLWVVDHKSGADLPKNFDLEIDDQFGLYEWLMSLFGLKLQGTIHNAARTTQNKGDLATDEELAKNKSLKRQTLDGRHSRTMMVRSEQELRNIAADAWAVAENIYFTGQGERPLYSAPDPRQCGWKCDFKEVHILSRKGRPITEALQEFGFRQDFTRH